MLATAATGLVVGDCSRIVAIGDIHGDMSALRSCLLLGGIVDSEGAWRAGQTMVVSTGDILGRGDDDWRCLKYLRSLKDEARAAGGDVSLVLGNHEVRNLLGDMTAVSKAASRAVARDCPDLPAKEARVHAFRAGGKGTAMLRDLCDDQPVVRVQGDTVFCHGGLHLSALDDTVPVADAVADANKMTADWLAGTATRVPDIVKPSAKSPLWSRAYHALVPKRDECRECREALDALDCTRMVVGHTPQSDGISSACDGRVYRIDTGAGRFYGSGPKEVLELRPGDDEPRILSAAVRFSDLVL